MTTLPKCRPLWTDWLWPVALMATIALASSRSTVGGPDLPYIDKVTHFLVYGLLGTLFVRVRGLKEWPVLGLGWAVVFASGYGVVDEWHQSFTPGRFVEFADWVADTLGALLAVTLYAHWTWYRKLLELSLVREKPSRRVEPAPVTVTEDVT